MKRAAGDGDGGGKARQPAKSKHTYQQNWNESLSPTSQVARAPQRRSQEPKNTTADERLPISATFSKSTFVESESSGCKTGACSLTRPSQEARWEDYDATNKLIVKELNELSFEDREFLYEDIHGVADQMKETPDFVEARLQSMQVAVNWIKVKPAYELARFMLPSSVEDMSLRLAMLRSTNFDAVQSARRLVKYFEFKLELFGVDKLVTHPITQDDLTEGMKECLRMGFIQILPIEDRVGRSIMFIASESTPHREDWRSVLGVNWYLSSKRIENLPTQTKGAVTIIYSVDTPSSMHNLNISKLMSKTVEFEACFPGRTSACHFCYNDARIRAFISIIQVAFGKNTRLRMRPHFGSHLEARYKLLSYGITPSSLPIDADGNINLDRWCLQLDSMQEAERSAAPQHPPETIIPTSKDCLLGRGYPFQVYIGNRYLADIVQRNRAMHSTLRRGKKTQVTIGILNYLKQVRGSRFLKKRKDGDEDIWILASDYDAREKIGHGFRGPERTDLVTTGESETYTFDDDLSIFVPPSL